MLMSVFYKALLFLVAGRVVREYPRTGQVNQTPEEANDTLLYQIDVYIVIMNIASI